MARAYKCDNCGDYFDGNDKDIINYIEFYNLITGRALDKIDVCPGCITAIEHALDKRKNRLVAKEVK